MTQEELIEYKNRVQKEHEDKVFAELQRRAKIAEKQNKLVNIVHMNIKAN